MPNAVRIGVIGDFEPAYHSHFATNAALYDAAAKLNVPLLLRWIPTLALARAAARTVVDAERPPEPLSAAPRRGALPVAAREEPTSPGARERTGGGPTRT